MTELQERVRSEEDGRPGADEWALVQAAIVDPAAFDPLYRRYIDPIYRFCYRRMGASSATSPIHTIRRSTAGRRALADR